MKAIAEFLSRLASSRLPRKMLRAIAGIPLMGQGDEPMKGDEPMIWLEHREDLGATPPAPFLFNIFLSRWADAPSPQRGISKRMDQCI
jgi:hypothetical protein